MKVFDLHCDTLYKAVTMSHGFSCSDHEVQTDVDFEKYPDQHCKKAPELLKEIDADDAFIHAVVGHGYGICVDVAPEHLMEKVL